MPSVSRVLFLLLIFLAAESTLGDQGDLLPSEVTILINHAMQANPGAGRRTLTEPLVERMRPATTDPLEQFLTGEVHFLNLDPEPSRDAFWTFRDADDDIGRVANQRLMTIRINAFRMIDEVLEKDIPQYEKRFGIRADDRWGITYPLQQTALALAERGEADRALDLIATYVRQHDQFDSPYTAYALPGRFMALAVENDREDEYREMMTWVLEGLGAAIDSRQAQSAADSDSRPGFGGAVFSSLFVDARLGFYEWTAEFLKLRDRIAAGSGSGR